MAIERSPELGTYGLASQLRTPEQDFKFPKTRKGSADLKTASTADRSTSPNAVWTEKSAPNLNVLRRQKAKESLRISSNLQRPQNGSSHERSLSPTNSFRSPLTSPTASTFSMRSSMSRPIGDLSRTPLPPLPEGGRHQRAPLSISSQRSALTTKSAHTMNGSMHKRKISAADLGNLGIVPPSQGGPLDLGIQIDGAPAGTFAPQYSPSTFGPPSPSVSVSRSAMSQGRAPQEKRSSLMSSRRGSLDSILKTFSASQHSSKPSDASLKDGPPPVIQRRHSIEDVPKAQDDASSSAPAALSLEMVPLAKRTAHVSWVPGYSWRLHLLERLETVSETHMSIQEAEDILTIGNGPNTAAKANARKSLIGMPQEAAKKKDHNAKAEASPTSRQGGFLNRMKRVLTANDSKKGEPAKAVFGRPLSDVAKYAFVTSVIAGQRHDLPGVAFSTVEEIYRRGTGPKIPGMLQKAGDSARLAKLVGIYNSPPDYGEHHDLASESVHDVCALLKKYLKDLPEPVLDSRLSRLFHAHCVDSTATMKQRIAAAQLILRLLPSANFSLMVYIVAFLSQIPLFPENRISLESVAVMFGQPLMAPRVTPSTVAAKLNRYAAGTMTITAPNETYEAEGQATQRAQKGLTWLLENWSSVADSLLEPDFDVDVDNVLGDRLNRNLKDAALSRDTLMIIGRDEVTGSDSTPEEEPGHKKSPSKAGAPIIISSQNSKREAVATNSPSSSPQAQNVPRLQREDSAVAPPVFLRERQISHDNEEDIILGGPSHPMMNGTHVDQKALLEGDETEQEEETTPQLKQSARMENHTADSSVGSAKEFPALMALNEDLSKQPANYESPTLKDGSAFVTAAAPASPVLIKNTERMSDEFGPLGRPARDGSVLDDFLSSDNSQTLFSFPSPPPSSEKFTVGSSPTILVRSHEEKLRDAQNVHDAQRKEIQTLWKQLTAFEVERASTRSQLDELRTEIERLKRGSMGVGPKSDGQETACQRELAALKVEHEKTKTALDMAKSQLDLAEKRHVEEQRQSQAQISSLISQLDGIRSVLGNAARI